MNLLYSKLKKKLQKYSLKRIHALKIYYKYAL